MVREYGSKAAPKMLVKLTTGVDFTNILMEAFMHADPEGAKDTDDLTVFLRFWDLLLQKLLVKCW